MFEKEREGEREGSWVIGIIFLVSNAVVQVLMKCIFTCGSNLIYHKSDKYHMSVCMTLGAGDVNVSLGRLFEFTFE